MGDATCTRVVRESTGVSPGPPHETTASLLAFQILTGYVETCAPVQVRHKNMCLSWSEGWD